jgi:hypothetical protein
MAARGVQRTVNTRRDEKERHKTDEHRQTSAAAQARCKHGANTVHTVGLHTARNDGHPQRIAPLTTATDDEAARWSASGTVSLVATEQWPLAPDGSCRGPPVAIFPHSPAPTAGISDAVARPAAASLSLSSERIAERSRSDWVRPRAPAAAVARAATPAALVPLTDTLLAATASVLGRHETQAPVA